MLPCTFGMRSNRKYGSLRSHTILVFNMHLWFVCWTFGTDKWNRNSLKISSRHKLNSRRWQISWHHDYKLLIFLKSLLESNNGLTNEFEWKNTTFYCGVNEYRWLARMRAQYVIFRATELRLHWLPRWVNFVRKRIKLDADTLNRFQIQPIYVPA